MSIKLLFLLVICLSISLGENVTPISIQASNGDIVSNRHPESTNEKFEYTSISKKDLEKMDLCHLCHCDEHRPLIGNTYANCEAYGFTEYPSQNQWVDSIHTLILSKNQIKQIGNLSNNSHIRVLKLDYNKINYIEPQELAHYLGLEVLDLSYNKIEKLNPFTFQGLEYLKVLNLTGNNIRQLPDLLFSTLVGLQEIRLSHNPLQSVSHMQLRNLIKIEFIDLAAIEAHYLNGDTFNSLFQLKKIDLSKNNFDEVPITALRSARGLEILKLSENKFVEFNEKSFKNLHLLKVLELEHLEELKIVKEFAFNSMPQLNVLKLRFCPQLAIIDPLAFSGLFNNLHFFQLTEVYLDNNNLETLDESTLPWDNMEIVDLQNNNWLCDCKMKWILNHTFKGWMNNDLRCAFPPNLRKEKLISLAEDQFVCTDYWIPDEDEIHHEKILRVMTIMLVALILFIFGLLLVMFFKRREIRAWWAYKKRKDGAIYYVRAHSNPGEQINDEILH